MKNLEFLCHFVAPIPVALEILQIQIIYLPFSWCNGWKDYRYFHFITDGRGGVSSCLEVNLVAPDLGRFCENLLNAPVFVVEYVYMVWMSCLVLTTIYKLVVSASSQDGSWESSVKTEATLYCLTLVSGATIYVISILLNTELSLHNILLENLVP